MLATASPVAAAAIVVVATLLVAAALAIQATSLVAAAPAIQATSLAAAALVVVATLLAAAALAAPSLAAASLVMSATALVATAFAVGAMPLATTALASTLLPEVTVAAGRGVGMGVGVAVGTTTGPFSPSSDCKYALSTISSGRTWQYRAQASVPGLPYVSHMRPQRERASGRRPPDANCTQIGRENEEQQLARMGEACPHAPRVAGGEATQRRTFETQVPRGWTRCVPHASDCGCSGSRQHCTGSCSAEGSEHAHTGSW